MTNTYSIITVTKNDAPRLQQTLRSIFSLRHNNFEVIVIDGNSTDNTKDVLSPYTESITVLTEPDNSIYDAMNKGIALAHNRWTIFLNAGDTFFNEQVLYNLDTVLLRLTNKAPTEPELICGLTQELFYNTSSIILPTRPISDMPVHMPACHQSIFTKTALLKTFLFNLDYKICADLEQLARITQHISSERILYVPFTIATVYAEGMSTQQWKRATQERKLIQRTYYNTHAHRKKLKAYLRTLIIKKYVRFFIPKKMQPFIRSMMHHNKSA